jgi:hypothetical protein
MGNLDLVKTKDLQEELKRRSNRISIIYEVCLEKKEYQYITVPATSEEEAVDIALLNCSDDNWVQYNEIRACSVELKERK